MKDFIEIMRKYEDILLESKRYREHYVHMFKVFTEGLYVINKIRPNLSENWKLISLVHDIGYPVQEFQEWSKRFFDIFEGPSKITLEMGVQNILQNNEFAEYIYIFSEILAKKKVFTPSMAKRIFLTALLGKEWHDHGLISALMCMHELKKPNNTKFLKKISPYDAKDIGLGIALHSFHYWKFFMPLAELFDNDYWDLAHIKFEEFPLIFLLGFFDLIQELGRPSGIQSEEDNKVTISETIEVNKTNTIVKASIMFQKENGEKITLDMNKSQKIKLTKKIFEVLCFIESFNSQHIHFQFVFPSVTNPVGKILTFCCNPNNKEDEDAYTNSKGSQPWTHWIILKKIFCSFSNKSPIFDNLKRIYNLWKP